MANPVWISATATANDTTSPKTTASIAVQIGDVLVAYGFLDNGVQTLAISTATGSTSAWTLQRDTAVANIGNPYLRAWTATATATGNITISFTRNAGTNTFLGQIKVWRNSGGVGATNRNDNGTGSGSPTVSVTTTGANSGLDFADNDWSAVTGAATFTASSGGTPVTDLSDQTVPTAYCIYSAHVLDAGAIGSKTFGMSAPAGQRYICDVIEILGISATTTGVGGSAELFAPKLGPDWRPRGFQPRLAFSAATIATVSGTLAATEAADVAAFNATFAVSGTLATTESADVAAFTATYTVSGALATTETADIAAFAGNTVVSGTLAATEAADVAAFAGNVGTSGTLATTEAADAAAFTGTVANQGAIAATETADVAAFTGNVGTSGTLAVTEPTDVALFVGSGISGTLNATEAPDFAAFTASVVNTGAGLGAHGVFQPNVFQRNVFQEDAPATVGGIGHYLYERELARQLAKITRKAPAPVDRRTAPTFKPIGSPPAAPAAPVADVPDMQNQRTAALASAAKIKRRREEEAILLLAS